MAPLKGQCRSHVARLRKSTWTYPSPFRLVAAGRDPLQVHNGRMLSWIDEIRQFSGICRCLVLADQDRRSLSPLSPDTTQYSGLQLID